MNDKYNFFDPNYGEALISKNISVVGRNLISTVNYFEVKSLQKVINETLKKINFSNETSKKQKKIKKDDEDENESENEENASAVESVENGESDGENTDELETESNITKLARNTFTNTKFICKLLGNYESESFITRP